MDRRGFLMSSFAAFAPGRKPSRIIDTHTHFYDPSRPQGVPWPPKDDRLLYRTVMPAEFRALAVPLGVTGTVVVEASPWLADNDWLLELAAKEEIILGVIGNLQPGKPEFAANLDRLRRNRLFRGIRLSGESIAGGLGSAAFIGDLKRLAAADLTLDALGGPEMLPAIARLANNVPGLRIVIDHLPFEAGGTLPHRERVYAKASNVVRRREALDELWSAFGPRRLVYGSNWPVSERAASYETALNVVRDYFASKGRDAIEAFFWRNAVTAYGISASRARG